jgi:hypothetical protein
MIGLLKGDRAWISRCISGDRAFKTLLGAGRDDAKLKRQTIKMTKIIFMVFLTFSWSEKWFCTFICSKSFDFQEKK